MKKLNNTLVIGIGNNGRQDDGLGWMFLDWLQEFYPNLHIEYRYQLQIEDAEIISGYDSVIFIDATKEQTTKGFYFRPCQPTVQHEFTTHQLEPGTVLLLTQKLYNRHPNAFIFTIQGYHWNLKMGLSNNARHNLEKAKNHFKNCLFF